MIAFSRALARMVGLILLTFWYLAPIFYHHFRKPGNFEKALEYRHRWAKRVMKLLGVRIEESGRPFNDSPAIFVSNHRSYFDPIVALKDVKAFPIAKAEVRKWPLIGMAAEVSGCIFVVREKKSSRRDALIALDANIKSGRSILIYPEGTTSDLPQTLEFRKGAFQLAARNQIPIVPVAIEYFYPSDAWIGRDTFVPHFFKCFGKKATPIYLSYGKPLESPDADNLVAQARTWIDGELRSARKRWNLPLAETAILPDSTR